MRRILLGALALAAAAIVLPPLWFSVFPRAAPELPPAGRRVVLPSGTGLNVVEQGDGPVVVLVHGLPGCAYDWRLLAAALAKRGRHVVAYDRAGYGRSDAPREGTYTFERNADDLLALLDALDVRGATLVGWSYGGGTALVALKKGPARVARLVLVGSVGPGAQETPPLLMRLAMSEPVLAWLGRVPPLANGLRAAVSEAAFSGQPEPGWWLPALEANFASASTRRTYAAETRSYPSEPVPDTSGLALPVLVIHGERDQLVPVAVGRELAKRAPHGRLDEVAGGSHMLPITHAEELANEIATFAGE